MRKRMFWTIDSKVLNVGRVEEWASGLLERQPPKVYPNLKKAGEPWVTVETFTDEQALVFKLLFSDMILVGPIG